MTRTRSGAAAATALACVLTLSTYAGSGPAIGLTDASAAATSSFCAPSSTPTVVWDGGAGTDRWHDADNWSPNGVPGVTDDPLSRVCLPGNATVVLDFGDDDGLTDVDSLDMAPGSRLTVVPSGRLLLEGAQSAVSSHVRRASDGTRAELVLEGVLGGRGNLVVDGVLRMRRTPSGPPTMTTRFCELTEAGCLPDVATTDPGRTTVGATGVLLVSGLPSSPANLQGSSLSDRRVIDVAGQMRIDSPAYLAVDDGTRIEVRDSKRARIVLDGDASIYQGRFAFGDPVAVLDLRGTIAKSAGGTGLLDMDVRVAASARSEVLRGRLSVGGDRAPRARVVDGSTYGVGRCDEANCVRPRPTAEDRLIVAVGVPRVRGRRTAMVQVAEKPGARTGADLVAPVDIHVKKALVSRRKPLSFTFTVDALSVGARTPGSLKVTRDGARVRACRQDGTPKKGRACVAARTLLAGGDVEIRVRSLSSSRWKIR